MAGCSRRITARTRPKRFANEVRVLRHLDARGCNFVPRLLEADETNLRIVTTNCGTRVETLTKNAPGGCSPSWKNSACATTTPIHATSPTGLPTAAFV